MALLYIQRQDNGKQKIKKSPEIDPNSNFAYDK